MEHETDKVPSACHANLNEEDPDKNDSELKKNKTRCARCVEVAFCNSGGNANS